MGDRIGFTGTRTMDDPDDALVIYDIVQELPPDAVLVVGACVGVDATVARAGSLSGRTVHAVVPANRAQVDPEFDRYCTSYEVMTEGTSYRDRNVRIVEQADRLIVIAQFPEDHPQSDRSGTWQTCRIARRAGKPVEIHVLRQ